MNTLRRAVTHYPLLAFFVLAGAFSWWSAPLANGALIPHGPALAAVIVLALASGRGGLAGLWRQVARWRMRWFWYLAAPALIAGLHFAAGGLNLLLGAAVASTGHIATLEAFAPALAGFLLMGGLWEEPGWTGFALPRLQARFAGRRHGAFIASLIAGALRAGWHLPLLVYGHLPRYDLIFIAFAIAASTSTAWPSTAGRAHRNRRADVGLFLAAAIVIAGAAAKRNLAAQYPRLVGLSTNGRQVTVAASGHNIHLEQPGVVIEAIRQLLPSDQE